MSFADFWEIENFEDRSLLIILEKLEEDDH